MLLSQKNEYVMFLVLLLYNVSLEGRSNAKNIRV